jgi:hypothetical protein
MNLERSKDRKLVQVSRLNQLGLIEGIHYTLVEGDDGKMLYGPSFCRYNPECTTTISNITETKDMDMNEISITHNPNFVYHYYLWDREIYENLMNNKKLGKNTNLAPQTYAVFSTTIKILEKFVKKSALYPK